MRAARSFLAATLACLSACGGASTPAAPPAPTPPPNRPPTVNVTGGSCHPHPDRPCTVALAAAASDPDGDALTYSWTGCASGNGPTAACVLTALGPFRAAVEVRDGRGGAAMASAEAVGSNAAPRIVYTYTPPARLAKSAVFYAAARVWDPDGDEDVVKMCQGLLVNAYGSCRAARQGCSREVICVREYCGVIAEFDVEIRCSPPNGDCVVESLAWDSWGDRASVRFGFYVD